MHAIEGGSKAEEWNNWMAQSLRGVAGDPGKTQSPGVVNS